MLPMSAPAIAAITTSRISGQIARLGLQPFADNARALLSIFWPRCREAVIHHTVGLDAKRVPNDLGATVAVVAGEPSLKAQSITLRVTTRYRV
jgi:hypothetical protein